MAVKLHRCSAMFVKIEVVKGPLRPGKRDELEKVSGQRKYPAIEFEDGTVYREESTDMAAKIRAGELRA